MVLLLLCCLSACVATRPQRGPEQSTPAGEPPRVGSTFRQVGVASWYGKAHHRHRTANGERFDMRAMTAAHRTLPFGTIVRVENLGNGREVKVRINDRGPYVRGRIIDLSAKAADALGIAGQGVAKVRLEVLPADQPRG